MRHLNLLVPTLVACLIASALWIVCDRPVPVEASWTEPLRSVSFAPFRRGQSPLTKTYPSPKQVEEDLRSLAGRTRGIRTYTAREGMEVVPDLAAKSRLKMIASAWLGKKPDINEAEIEALIAQANGHPDVIERVIVGNEVLLRGDLSAEVLIAAIRRVKAAVKQPVSYADVWAFYLRYPEIANEVDFLTIHVLPFWEDEPTAIDRVEGHIVETVDRIRRAFPGKPILIGEAGWPSLGRDRGPAVVSTVNEARFVREMANIAAKYDFDYNIVEAFDQPWKAKLENTVGAAWGVLDVDRQPKFAMSGPVTEVADWPIRAVIAVAAGAIVTLAWGGGCGGPGGATAFALMAQLLAWMAITTAFHAEAVSFAWWQDIWAILRGGLGITFAAVVLDRLRHVFAGLDGGSTWGRRYGEDLALFVGLYAFVWSMLLAFDGRYRDIPGIDFSVPVGGIAVLLIAQAIAARRRGGSFAAALSLDGLFGPTAAGISGSRRASLVRGLSWGLPFAALATIVGEGFAVVGDDFVKDHQHLAEQIPLVLRAMLANREADLWALMQLVLAVPFTVSRFNGICLPGTRHMAPPR